MRRSYELSESGVEKALTELPNGLDEMYSRMLQRVSENESHRTSAIVDIALKLVLCTFRPLTSEELLDAISFAQPSAGSSRAADLTLPAVLGVCQYLLILGSRLITSVLGIGVHVDPVQLGGSPHDRCRDLR